MEPKLNVAICGGGNLAHGSTAAISHFNPQFSVRLLSRRPEVWQKEIVAFTKGSSWENKGDLTGKLDVVSAEAENVVKGADVVIICSPAHTKSEILKQIKPWIKKGALIGTIFGQGAFDLQARHVLGTELIEEMQLTIFSLQYVPFICKVNEYGKNINIIGPKKCLYATAYPLEKVHYACNALSQLYFLPCVPIPGFLNLTLCPSNQIIHPGRVTGFFSRFEEGANKILKKSEVPLLYEDLDEVCADEIQKLDDEIQKIKFAILEKYPNLNLDQVMPIKDRICTMYSNQITDRSSLKRVFNTNLGYSRVPFPMMPVEGQDPNTPAGDVQVKLNFNARFFWEDMPYGLCILKDIGNIVGVPTPNITRNIIFHQQYMPVKYVNEQTKEFNEEVLLTQTGAPSAYGIKTIEDLVKSSLGQEGFAQHNIFFKHKL